MCFLRSSFLCKYCYPEPKRWPDLTSLKIAADLLHSYIFWLQVHIQIIFMKKVPFFQTSYSNWKYCKLGAKKFFPNLLMFFQQHSITGRDIWNSYSLILYFLHELWLNGALQQLLFQQTYYLFLRWLAISNQLIEYSLFLLLI